MAQAPQPRTNNAQLIAQSLEDADWSPKLPQHIKMEKFRAVCNTAMNVEPKLIGCTRKSLMLAFSKCAEHGLLPDGRQAAIIPYGDKAGFVPMIHGLEMKAWQSAKIRKFNTRLVYMNDFIDIEGGMEDRIIHRPTLDGDPGPIRGAYAVAWLTSGLADPEYMTVSEIERIRDQFSKAKGAGTPWKTSFGEMCRKTVAHRLLKRLPLSTELDALIADDQSYNIGGMRDVTPTPAAVAPPRPTRAQQPRRLATVPDEPEDDPAETTEIPERGDEDQAVDSPHSSDSRSVEGPAASAGSRQDQEGHDGAHGPDATGNPANQGAPGEGVEAPHESLAIPVPDLADDEKRWKAWTNKYRTAIKAAQSEGELADLERDNKAQLDGLKKFSTGYRSRVDAEMKGAYESFIEAAG